MANNIESNNDIFNKNNENKNNEKNEFNSSILSKNTMLNSIVDDVTNELRLELKDAFNELLVNSMPNADKLVEYLRTINAFTKYGGDEYKKQIETILLEFTKNYRNVMDEIVDIIMGENMNSLINISNKGSKKILSAAQPVIDNTTDAVAESGKNVAKAVPVIGTIFAIEGIVNNWANAIEKSLGTIDKVSTNITDVSNKVSDIVEPIHTKSMNVKNKLSDILNKINKINSIKQEVSFIIKKEVIKSILCSKDNKLSDDFCENEEKFKALINSINDDFDINKIDFLNDEDMKKIRDMDLLNKLDKELGNKLNELDPTSNLSKSMPSIDLNKDNISSKNMAGGSYINKKYINKKGTRKVVKKGTRKVVKKSTIYTKKHKKY